MGRGPAQPQPAPASVPKSRAVSRPARGPAGRFAIVALAVAVGALALAAAHRADGTTKITVLDVGQGDSILVEGGQGGRMLVDGGLLSVERHGRHRYYRLADPAVAEALEALAVIAPVRPPRSLRAANRAAGIHVARTCYDHLAGALGVALLDALVSGRILVRLDGAVDLTPQGARQLFARLCLDWTERKYHLAGGLGAALTTRLFQLGWIERSGSGRAVRVTEAGRAGFERELGFQPQAS